MADGIPRQRHGNEPRRRGVPRGCLGTQLGSPLLRNPKDCRSIHRLYAPAIPTRHASVHLGVIT